jgi:hypothetical protein
MRDRLTGLGLLAFAALIGYAIATTNAFPLWTRTIGMPFLLATGTWLAAFGHPKRPDGLAPVWWRLGILGWAILLLAIRALVLPM